MQELKRFLESNDTEFQLKGFYGTGKRTLLSKFNLFPVFIDYDRAEAKVGNKTIYINNDKTDIKYVNLTEIVRTETLKGLFKTLQTKALMRHNIGLFIGDNVKLMDEIPEWKDHVLITNKVRVRNCFEIGQIVILDEEPVEIKTLSVENVRILYGNFKCYIINGKNHVHEEAKQRYELCIKAHKKMKGNLSDVPSLILNIKNTYGLRPRQCVGKTFKNVIVDTKNLSKKEAVFAATRASNSIVVV